MSIVGNKYTLTYKGEDFTLTFTVKVKSDEYDEKYSYYMWAWDTYDVIKCSEKGSESFKNFEDGLLDTLSLDDVFAISEQISRTLDSEMEKLLS